MTPKVTKLVTLVALGLIIAGCGIKGPLEPPPTDTFLAAPF